MTQNSLQRGEETSPISPDPTFPTDATVGTLAPVTPPVAEASRGGAAAKVGGLILAVLFATLFWNVAADRLAPTSASGSVAATTALVAPRVAGQVQQVMVIDNQAVLAGEALFVLDPAPFDLAVRQAEANLAQATQTVGASVVSLTSSEAKVRQAEAGLQGVRATTERTLSLFARGLTSLAQVDAAKSQLASATAAFDAAQAELESARLKSGEDGTPNPQVAVAQVQLEQAILNRSFATIIAPTDGVVTNLKLAPGQFVNAGTAALTFIENDSLWMVVDMRENQLANVAVGDPASVVFDGVPGTRFEARVRGIAWGIDPGRTAANGLPQNQSMARWFEPARTIPVHLELSDPGVWPANVRVGSKVSALVYAGGPDTLVARGAGVMQTISAYLSYLN